MNTLDGRLLLELRAMRDARKGNIALPALRVGVLRRTRKKAAAAPIPAPQPI
jgi:hypothetical protein